MTSFWRQQKSAIYFGLFLLISVGLIFYSQSKTPEKARKLVQFSLEIVEKIEKNNLEILEMANQNFEILENKQISQLSNSSFSNSSSSNSKIQTSSLTNSLNQENSLSNSTLKNQNNSQTLSQNQNSISTKLSTNLPKKIDKSDFENLIDKIDKSQKSLENLSWPESSFGSDTEIISNLAKKLVEINQKNWHEITIRLNLEKDNLGNLEIWANLEEDVKNRNLEKTQKSLEIGREFLQKSQQKLFQNLKKNETEEIEKNEKELERIDKSLKNLAKIMEIKREAEKISKNESEKVAEKSQNNQISKNNSQNSSSILNSNFQNSNFQNLTNSSDFNKNFNSKSEIINKVQKSSDKFSEKTVEKEVNSSQNSSQSLEKDEIKTDSNPNKDSEEIWQEIENTFDKNWPKSQTLSIKIDQIETENWLSTKSELSKQSKNLLKKYK